METREYRTMDKSDWGDGPWQDEPDKKQWQDDATGMPCLIVRNPLGALCGYVGLTPDHPLYAKPYSVIDDKIDGVHGGLTFADFLMTGAPGEPENVFWVGFDCAHAFDLMSGMQAMLRNLGHKPFHETHPDMVGRYPQMRDTYKHFAYVVSEVEGLAASLASLGHAQ